LKLLLEVPQTDRKFIQKTLAEKDVVMLAHLFFHLHFYFVKRLGSIRERLENNPVPAYSVSNRISV